VHAIDPANPITDIKVWLPDPADPQHQSLEGQLFHPTFLQRLADADWGFIRFMNFMETNANPQQEQVALRRARGEGHADGGAEDDYT